MRRRAPWDKSPASRSSRPSRLKGHQTRKRTGAAMPKTTKTSQATARRPRAPSGRTILKRYREALEALCADAVAAGPTAFAGITRRVGELLQGLNDDLIALYDRRERGRLTDTEAETVVPVLEAIRAELRAAMRPNSRLAERLGRAARAAPARPRTSD